jgi:hypothetical protein
MRQHESTFQGFLMFKEYRRTWAFPREVEHRLREESVNLGKSTLHLYGGLATFGSRLDADPKTRPDVIGNALYPPFRCKSFDVVIASLRGSQGWCGAPDPAAGGVSRPREGVLVPHALGDQVGDRDVPRAMVGVFAMLDGLAGTHPGRIHGDEASTALCSAVAGREDDAAKDPADLRLVARRPGTSDAALAGGGAASALVI